ncbi:carbohydrate ABC transporter permease [Paenibacillus chartarius]|uniref:Carbohydrate ABC transporter permease n=1 Tax=Paenibacillus chartarius TaxID=747481 RepID=A0ABV6DLC6_9BACL
MSNVTVTRPRVVSQKGGLRERKWKEGVVLLLLAVYGLLTIYPLFWLFISAFKTNVEFMNRPFGFPAVLQWSNFTRAWDTSKMGRAFMNSAIVSLVSLALTLVISALSSYILARFNFKLKGFVMGFFVVGMLIPMHSTLVPLFILMKQLSILNTYAALVLPYVAFALPTAIFILTAYLVTFPKEIEEAAYMDGSGLWGVFFRIMLPVSTPALSTVGIISFLHFWNDYSFSLVFISKSALKTLPLSVATFADGFATDYSLTLAAMTIAVIPTILVYLIFQEQVMKGMTAGAVKG